MKKHTVSFKFDHGEIVFHKSDKNREMPLTIIMQQGRVMTDATMTKWYLCRMSVGNMTEVYCEIELVK
jgi:hypothetical protein